MVRQCSYETNRNGSMITESTTAEELHEMVGNFGDSHLTVSRTKTIHSGGAGRVSTFAVDLHVNLWPLNDYEATTLGIFSTVFDILPVVEEDITSSERDGSNYGPYQLQDHKWTNKDGSTFRVSVITYKSASCTREKVGTKTVHHSSVPAIDAWSEEVPVYKEVCK